LVVFNLLNVPGECTPTEILVFALGTLVAIMMYWLQWDCPSTVWPYL